MSEPATILIIDDEPTVRETHRALLEREGYRMCLAPDGQAGLDQVASDPPDVILLDVMMPGLDGYTVCRRLKAEPKWQPIPVILVTALDSKADIVRGLDAGADEFLSKPVNGLELRARVRSMLRIKQQYDRLAGTLELREALARMLVHDLRNPLNSIAGFSDLLLGEEELGPTAKRFAGRIHEQAGRLGRMITDLLMQAKMEAGKLILNRQPVDPGELARRSVENAKVVAESKRIRLECEAPAQMDPIGLDATLWERVVDNLLSNSIKFSPAGGSVRVEVGLQEGPAGRVLRVTVRDEGPGIPPEHRERIFDSFGIVEAKQKGITQIGLGLAFCKMVVEVHGGRIWAEPNQPAGSAFVVEVAA